MKNNASFRRDRMKKGIYVLPNLFTTANLFCGFYSVIASMKEMYEIAAMTILIAVVLDSLDGRIARMTHTTSKFGGEYDSLCDLVTFGVAPAILVYNWSLLSYGKWGWLGGFSIRRLRSPSPGPVQCPDRRHRQPRLQRPAHTGRRRGRGHGRASVLLPWWEKDVSQSVDHDRSSVAIALFMVSSIKYYSFKDLNYFSRKPFMSFVLIVVILVIVVAEPQIMLFTFAFGYSLSGPVWTLCRLGRKLLTEFRTKKSQCQDHPL